MLDKYLYDHIGRLRLWKQRLLAVIVGAATVGVASVGAVTIGMASAGDANTRTKTVGTVVKLKCYECGSNKKCCD